MGVSIDEVKQLRDQTGVSIMQCKKALEEVDGDLEKALIILKKKSSEIAAKKSDRELGAGAIGSYLHNNGTVAAMVVLSCETDFVSQNEEFRALAKEIAMQVAAMNPAYVSTEDVPEEEMQKAREVFAKDVEGKPEDIQEKIMEGKLASHFGDQVLLAQPTVKNPDTTIGNLLTEATQKFGERIVVSQMVRLSV